MAPLPNIVNSGKALDPSGFARESEQRAINEVAQQVG